MNHVTHLTDSCHTYGRVMSHIWMSHVTHMNESHLTDTLVNICPLVSPNLSLVSRLSFLTDSHTAFSPVSFLTRECIRFLGSEFSSSLIHTCAIWFTPHAFIHVRHDSYVWHHSHTWDSHVPDYLLRDSHVLDFSLPRHVGRDLFSRDKFSVQTLSLCERWTKTLLKKKSLKHSHWDCNSPKQTVFSKSLYFH